VKDNKSRQRQESLPGKGSIREVENKIYPEREGLKAIENIFGN